MHKKYGLFLICFVMPLFASDRLLKEFKDQKSIIDNYGLVTSQGPLNNNNDWQIKALRRQCKAQKMKLTQLEKLNDELTQMCRNMHTKQTSKNTAAIIIGSVGGSTPSSNGSSPTSDLAVSPFDGLLSQINENSETMEELNINDESLPFPGSENKLTKRFSDLRLELYDGTKAKLINIEPLSPNQCGNRLTKRFSCCLMLELHNGTEVSTVVDPLQSQDNNALANKLKKPFSDAMQQSNNEIKVIPSESVENPLSKVSSHYFNIEDHRQGSGNRLTKPFSSLIPLLTSHLPV